MRPRLERESGENIVDFDKVFVSTEPQVESPVMLPPVDLHLLEVGFVTQTTLEVERVHVMVLTTRVTRLQHTASTF